MPFGLSSKQNNRNILYKYRFIQIVCAYVSVLLRGPTEALPMQPPPKGWPRREEEACLRDTIRIVALSQSAEMERAPIGKAVA
jgi:hypothetical protein